MEEVDEEEDDDEGEEEDEEEDVDVVDEGDEEDEESDDEETSIVVSTDKNKAAVSEYDAMLIPSPAMQMYSVIGVMLLSRKLDMFNPTVVRAGR